MTSIASRSIGCQVSALVLVATSAMAQSSYTPVAFGPIGPAPAGQYYNSTLAISHDGMSILATTNTGVRRYVTATSSYTFSGTGTAFSMTPDGQTLVGGQSGSNPQRWRLSNLASNNIVSETITWPGGPLALGPAYGTSADGSVAVVLQPSVSVVGSFGRVQSSSIFVGGTAGAYRDTASNAPVVGMQGFMPGNTTFAYRWNYATNALVPCNMPAGASSVSLSTTTTTLSADGSIAVGSATFGLIPRAYWWDAAGTPTAVPLLPGASGASALTVNPEGTLIGGGMNMAPGVTNAYIVSLADNTIFNLHQIYSAAGILPTGWTLVATQHISTNGSRIFCLATDATGTSRSIVVDGSFVIPAPSTAALLGLAGVAAMRRRRQ